VTPNTLTTVAFTSIHLNSTVKKSLTRNKADHQCLYLQGIC